MQITPLPHIEVFRYNAGTNTRELVVSSREGVLDTSDTVAIQTYNAALDVIRYYKNTYNRSSYDNKNSDVKIVVGYTESTNLPLNNAFWNTEDKTMYFGDGDGNLFSPLGTAYDVVAHEFAHAIIENEVPLVYNGQSGGIHESVADILSTGVDNNLTIAESVFTPKIKNDSLRDLGNLTHKTAPFLQRAGKWANEPHLMSEPLSHAAVLASQFVGLDVIRKIWYTATVDYLKPHSGFTGFRQATLSAASLYGPEVRQSILDAWKAVEIE